LERYKFPGIDKIPAELIQAGGKILHSQIHKVFNSVWNKQELPQQWEESTVIFIYRQVDETDCSNYKGITLLPTTYTVLFSILLRSQG
jgi:hypothetical protein